MTSILIEAAGNGQLDETALAAAVFELAEEGELGIRYSPARITLERRSTPIDNLDKAQKILRARILPHRAAVIPTAVGARPTFSCLRDIQKVAAKSQPRRDPGASALREGTISWLLWSCSGDGDARMLADIAEWVSANRLPAWWIANNWSATSALQLQTTFKALTRAFE